MQDNQRITQEEFFAQLDSLSLPGSIMILGAQDMGKSTLARYLVGHLAQEKGSSAWLDGDIGQSTLGMPTTMNLGLVEEGQEEIPPSQCAYFVGYEDAAGGRLPLLTGLKRLQEESIRLGANSLVVDTTGFVDKAAGGLALKQYKIELLQPEMVIALQVRRELEPVLAPIRKHPRIRVIDLYPAPETRNRSRETRIHNRRLKLQQYFSHCREVVLQIPEVPVYDLPRCRINSLVGLLDERGFCLSLGLVFAQEDGKLHLHSPVADPEAIAGARISSLRLDPQTGLTF